MEAGQVSHRQRHVKRCERGAWQSAWSIVPRGRGPGPPPEKVGNQSPRDPLEGRPHRAGQQLEGKPGESLSSPTVSTTHQRMTAQARQHPARQFLTLAHLIDADLLREASCRTCRTGAPGGDGVTAEESAANLAANPADLHKRLRRGQY